MEDSTEELYLFRPARLLGEPSVIAPPESGKISVSLQFIIPNVHISDAEKGKYRLLMKNCLSVVWDSDVSNLKNEAGAQATLVTVAFYVDNQNGDNELHQAIENKSRILIERFLGVVSYCCGVKLSGRNIVNTIIDGSNFKAILHMTDRTQCPQIKFSIPQELIENKVPSDEIFTALFWLRRGLAESDPIDTYNAFMVCLQILARDWFKKKYTQNKIPSISSQFEDYIITELKGDEDQVIKAWKKRNAIAAHGNKLNISADDLLGLTELKFEAANWAYKGINLALGLDLEKAPKPSQNFFVTDALMNLD